MQHSPDESTAATLRPNSIVANPITLKISTTAVLAAIGIVLSYLNPFGYITIFGAKINPFAHLINAIAGVILGPLYAMVCALIIATVRYSVGIGSILAFPGGISGAFVVGMVRDLLLRMYRKRVLLAALAEPIGTVFIGATISSLIIPVPMLTLWLLFALSCIPGCVLGFLLLLILDKAGYVDLFLPNASKNADSTKISPNSH